MKRPSSATIRRASLFYTALLLIAAAVPYAGNAHGEEPRKPSSGPTQAEMVLLTVTVTSKDGRPIANLRRDAFTVLDGKEPREIELLLSEDKPASVGILFDMSGSMIFSRADLLNASIQGVWNVIQRSNESNSYFVAGFRGHNELLADWTNDARTILETLKGLGSFKPSKDGTALYDACLFGIEKVSQRAGSKHVILLITDGEDETSQHRLDDVRRAIRESDCLVYICAFIEKDPFNPLTSVQIGLTELSSLSGGEAYFPISGKSVSDTFSRIALELRHQYRIGFHPRGVLNGQWRRVTVRVRAAEAKDSSKPQQPAKFTEFKVRTRAGYYAK